MSGTRARKESIKVNVEYIGGKLFDSTGLSDGEGFAYDLATDKFLPVPLTATGDMFAANNLSDVANATTALSNLGGEPAIGTKGTAFNLNFGTTAGTVAEGNHSHDTVYAASGHDHSGTYEPANANIQAHISETDNPHGVTLLQLAGFPSAYVADKWMKVNATANGIEFVDAPTGGGGGTWGSITGTLADQTDLQSALEGKAASDHAHAGVYEAANANIQSHISDINKHIDWTGTNQNLSTSGYIRISVPGSAHFTLEGNTTSGKTIHFIGPGALGDICFGSNSPNMDFNVGTKRPLRLMPTGAIQMAEYGESTFAGTPTTFAGWDVDGNLIETAKIPFSAISGTPTTLAGYGITDGGGTGGASVAIDDTAPTGTETMWYQPSKGVFALLVDSQWVDVGRNGIDGDDGDSAYVIWLGKGNSGTEQDFLDSLVGSGGGLGFISVILTKSVNQNVGGANGTEVWWTWDGETRKDTEFTHDNSTNSGRVYVGTTGWYKIRFIGAATTVATSSRTTLQGIYRINGGSTLWTGSIRNYTRGSGYGNCSPELECTIELTAGDYIEIGTAVEDTDSVYTLNTNGTENNDEENQLVITRLE